MKKAKSVGKKPTFCVLGAGHGGLAMAGHLAIMGFKVNLYNRSEERLLAVKARGGISVDGEVDGFGTLSIITTNIQEAIEDADVLMVVVPAYAHRFMAEKVAPYLKDGQIIILNPGRTFGAIEFRHVLEENQCKADVIISEAQTLIYASRISNPGQVKIFSIKNSVPVASIHAYKIPEVLNIVRKAYPLFVPGDNVFKTSLNNIGSVFHPAIMLLNTGWVESFENFEFYTQGCSLSVSKVLEKIDEERVSVASAIGIRAMKAREWLYFAYDASGKDLYEAMHANPGYSGIKAPNRMNMRYIKEDVPMSLVPIASIGEMLGVQVPAIKSIIYLASAMLGVDFWSEGRTVERLGIKGMSVKQLRLMAIGEKK